MYLIGGHLTNNGGKGYVVLNSNENMSDFDLKRGMKGGDGGGGGVASVLFVSNAKQGISTVAEFKGTDYVSSSAIIFSCNL